jgi:hypothetical protein
MFCGLWQSQGKGKVALQEAKMLLETLQVRRRQQRR